MPRQHTHTPSAFVTRMHMCMCMPQVVKMLNDVYKSLDAIAERHGLHKVETYSECPTAPQSSTQAQLSYGTGVRQLSKDSADETTVHAWGRGPSRCSTRAPDMDGTHALNRSCNSA